MRHWLTRVLVLLFTAAWFGVVVPGHQRGAISFPGTAVSTANLPPCHQKRLPQSPTSPATPRQCIICTLAAMTSPPPVVEEVSAPAFAAALAVEASQSIASAHTPLPVSERGPPLV